MHFTSPNTSKQLGVFTKTAFVALLGTFAPSYTNAWWNTGHLTVARIAYDDLVESGDQYIIDYVETKLEVLRTFVHSEDQHAFVECATFADFIKNSGFDFITNFHFVDTPFFDEGFQQPEGYSFETMNVEWAISMMRSQILDPVGTVYGAPQKITPVDTDLSESFNFRLLIHYIGDIHQPLHAVSRFTPKYPNGDAGGNAFLIEPFGPEGNQIANMHELWDSILGFYADTDPQQPLNDDDWDWLGSLAENISTTYSRDYFGPFEFFKPLSMWANDSLEVAKEWVYTDIEDDGAPVSQEYLDSRKLIAYQQLAKGGYRLADYLRGIAHDLGLEDPAESSTYNFLQ